MSASGVLLVGAVVLVVVATAALWTHLYRPVRITLVAIVIMSVVALAQLSVHAGAPALRRYSPTQAR